MNRAEMIERLEAVDPANGWMMGLLACDLHLALGQSVIPKGYKRGSSSGRYLMAHGPRGAVWSANVPNYLGSVDAALALAERVLVAPYTGPISMTIAGSGQAYIDHIDPCGTGVQAFGKTPALALCVAILRAHDTGERET